jgi:hypothetical protein
VRGFSEPRHVESLAGAVNHIGDADDGGPGSIRPIRSSAR